MIFGLTTAILLLKQKIRILGIWILLGAMLLSCFLVYYAAHQQSNTVRTKVGIAFSANDVYAKSLADSLEQLELIELEYLIDKTPEELPQLLLKTHYNCIYYIPPTLKHNLVTGQVEDAIIVFTTPSSTLTGFLNKWIFATAIAEASVDISAYQLSKQLSVSEHEAYKMLTQSFDWYENHSPFVSLEEHWYTGNSHDTPNTNQPLFQRALAGIPAFFLLLFTLLFLYQDIPIKEQSFSALSPKQRAMYLQGQVVADTILLLVISSIGFLPLYVFTPNRSFINLLIYLVLYSILLACVEAIITLCSHSNQWLWGVSIFVILYVLLLGGIFFNPSDISAFLGTFAVITPTIYITAALLGESTAPLVILSTISLVCLGAILFIFRTKKKSLTV